MEKIMIKKFITPIIFCVVLAISVFALPNLTPPQPSPTSTGASTGVSTLPTPSEYLKISDGLAIPPSQINYLFKGASITTRCGTDGCSQGEIDSFTYTDLLMVPAGDGSTWQKVSDAPAGTPSSMRFIDGGNAVQFPDKTVEVFGIKGDQNHIDLATYERNKASLARGAPSNPKEEKYHIPQAVATSAKTVQQVHEEMVKDVAQKLGIDTSSKNTQELLVEISNKARYAVGGNAGNLYLNAGKTIDYSVSTPASALTSLTTIDGKVITSNQLQGGIRQIKINNIQERLILPDGTPLDKEFQLTTCGSGESNCIVRNAKTGEEYKVTFNSVEGNKQYIIDHGTGDEREIKKITERPDGKVTEITKGNDDNEIESITVTDEGGKVIAKKNNDLLDGDNKFSFYELLDEKGNVIGICKDSSKCDGSPNNNANIYSSSDGLTCTGSHDVCYVEKRDKEGKPFIDRSAAWQPCEGKPNCAEAVDRVTPLFGSNLQKGGIFAKDSVWSTYISDPEYGKRIGMVMSVRPGYEGVLSRLFGKDNVLFEEQAKDFLNNWPTIDKVTARACDLDNKVSSDGSAAIMIDVGAGQVQSVASLFAEKSPSSTPALCASDVPCSKGECHDDGICYDENGVVEANLYKINWMVKAPADEKSTPKVDEDGYPISYNIQIRGGPEGPLYLYPADSFGSKSTLRLKNGETDKDLYITYSPIDYTEICLLFENGPLDLNTEILDNDREEITEVCTDFATTAPGSNPFGSDISSGSSGQPSQRVADVGRKNI